MKAITLWQPWATLISLGLKTIELEDIKGYGTGMMAMISDLVRQTSLNYSEPCQ